MSCRWSARAQRPGTFIPLSPRLITPGSVGPPRGRQPVVGQAAPSAARRALALPGSEFAASPHSNLTLRRAPALSHPHISRRRRPASSRRISAPPAADGRVAPPTTRVTGRSCSSTDRNPKQATVAAFTRRPSPLPAPGGATRSSCF